MARLLPDFKATDRPAGRFLFLLVSLVLYLFVIPIVDEVIHLKFLLDIFFSLVLVAAVYAVSVRVMGLVIGLFLAAPMLVSVWLAHLVTLKSVTVAAQFFTIAFMAYCILVFLRFILVQKKITPNIIYAAIVVYLLLGLMWALLYSLMHVLEPGSFHYGELPIGSDMIYFVYYSFITLTTLGYGDITPIARWAVSFSALEAMTGQLYLAVLVARLVGLHISQDTR